MGRPNPDGRSSDLRQEPGALAAHAGICAGGERGNLPPTATVEMPVGGSQSIVRLTPKMLSSKSLVIGPSQTPVEAIFAQVLLRWLLEMNYGYTRKFQTLEFR